MGYVEEVLGNNERVLYSTHQHVIVLLQRIVASLFVFVVFLVLGLVVLLPKPGDSGDEIRFAVGLIALGSLVMPGYLIVSAWLRGLRGREFAQSIWRAALAAILILVIALIMLIRPGFKLVGWIAIVVALVPAFELGRILLDWLNERYIITNRRVMEVTGIVNKHVRDSALEKVNDVDLRQSVVGRILRYGTVQIITGSDIGVNRFRRISNPVRFKREMLNAKEELQTPTVPAADEEDIPMPQSADAEPVAKEDARVEGADVPDLIIELSVLRQQGLISEEEFEEKKKELLDRL